MKVKKVSQPSPRTVAYRKSLGERIKLLRDIIGITQAQLAAALGYSEKFLSSVENGRKGMKMQKIKEAAGILGVPSEALLTEKDLTREQLEIMHNLWKSFDLKDNPMNPALLALSQQAADVAKKE